MHKSGQGPDSGAQGLALPQHPRRSRQDWTDGGGIGFWTRSLIASTGIIDGAAGRRGQARGRAVNGAGDDRGEHGGFAQRVARQAIGAVQPG